MEIKYISDAVKQCGFEPMSSHAAGYDLRASISESVDIEDGEIVVIPTGVAIHMGSAFSDSLRDGEVIPCAVIMPRSGLGCRGVKPANAPGLIDADYQGEILVCLENNSGSTLRVNPLDRIAQLVFMTALRPIFNVVTEFSSETPRGENGLGSTGVR